jgi:hypothetical protein
MVSLSAKVLSKVVLFGGVVLIMSGCLGGDDDEGGCSKDSDCAAGRICENRACITVDGSGGTTGDGGCTSTGMSCEINGNCCSFQVDDGYCVGGTCADACASNSECASGCCAALEGGGAACAPASICEQTCTATGSGCAINGDCCSFLEGDGYCVDGTCADACASNSECVSGCCAALEGGGSVCAPAVYCG